MTEQSLLVPV